MTSTSWHLRLCSAGATVEQNFVFCAPHVTDDGISCSSKLKGGRRQYIVTSISKITPDQELPVDSSFSTPAIGNDTKEGAFVTSTTGSVSPRHMQTIAPTRYFYGGVGKGLHTFRFVYITRDAVEGILTQPPPQPSNPPPPPSIPSLQPPPPSIQPTVVPPLVPIPAEPSDVPIAAEPPVLPGAAELPIVPVAAEPVHVKAEGNPTVPKRMKLEHQGLPRNNIALVSNNQVVDLTADDSADDKAGGPPWTQQTKKTGIAGRYSKDK
ncbi:hypothetical protein H257_12336 [Aphanomyces astaci]|uniref:Uncharacterized protein n=1 Tax=Aphanomyces astaci TaxID=112090 RepID=W4FYL9_APHAT|nr:hypothetical protein H257_12336 [Aphanomyces astaci]ETV72570.1 hypothetical protein H257_12336 [Aphanomyces astaci]|eukprot:XP_009837798.1 hypothetical protein H257_12336 [Aphanomyces astaci]